MVNILSNITVQMSTALMDKPDKPEYYFLLLHHVRREQNESAWTEGHKVSSFRRSCESEI